MNVGVLALQGDFAAHAAALRESGARTIEVRRTADLAACGALALPGGESTTLLKLMQPEGMLEAIREFHRGGKAIFGTCAGAILLAREVIPAQTSLGLVDVAVERNAYGRQRESFEATAISTDGFPGGAGIPLPMLFIRAPRLREPGPSVEVLATLGDEPVLARDGNVLLGTGHPELTPDRRIHRLFLELAAGNRREAARGRIPFPGAA